MFPEEKVKGKRGQSLDSLPEEAPEAARGMSRIGNQFALLDDPCKKDKSSKCFRQEGPPKLVCLEV